MYRLLAIAKAEDRYVIPKAHGEPGELADHDPGCSLDVDGGPGMGGIGIPAMLSAAGGTSDPATAGRVNLLNWDGNGRPAGLFPPRPQPDSTPNPAPERTAP